MRKLLMVLIMLTAVLSAWRLRDDMRAEAKAVHPENAIFVTLEAEYEI